ncbi:MAG: hypothetical protein AAFW98_10740, partial [Pseudomonadota bacterium]
AQAADAAVEPTSQTKSETEAASKDRGASSRSRSSRGKSGPGREDRGDQRVIFSKTPYVPAFLLRPIAPRRTTKESASAE